MKKIVSVNLLFTEAYRQRYWPILSSVHLLSSLGIEILDNSEEFSDVCIVQSDLYPVLRSRNHPGLSGILIIHERADQETVVDSNRKLLQSDMVKGWIKESSIRDPSLHNAPHVMDYYHLTLFPQTPSDPRPKTPEILLTESDIAKVISFISVANFSRFDVFRNIHESRLLAKDIDVFCYGTTRYSTGPIERNRINGASELGRLSDKKILLATGYILPEHDLIEYMARSKMIVSPTGHAMSSYKDWQALFTETIAIKPRGVNLQTNHLPDIFAIPGWYVECEPDFSDLRDVVENIIDNYQEWRVSAREARMEALKYCTNERIAITFNALIRTVLAGGRASEWNLYPEPDHIPVKGVSLSFFYDHIEKIAGSVAGRSIWSSDDDHIAAWSAVRARLSLASDIEAPEGSSVLRLEEDLTPSDTHDMRRHTSKLAVSQRIRFSLLAKADSRDSLVVWLFGKNQELRSALAFNVRDSSVGLQEHFGAWGQPVGGVLNIHDGWKICWIETDTDDSPTIGVLIGLGLNGRTIAYDGDGGNGLWVSALRMDVV